MRIIILSGFLAIAPATGIAQIGNPAMMAPDTRFDAPGVPAPNQTNTTDRLFARLATESGLAEVAFGELAAQKAGSTTAGDFARRMTRDHSSANETLAGIAGKSRIPLPEELNAEHKALLEQLQTVDGADFDLAYMRGQIVEHQKAAQLLIWEIGFGQDAELQRWAAETLVTVLDHLHDARAIVADLALEQVARSDTPAADE